MKVAYIIDEFPVLSATFVLNQITGLLDRGHEVDIFANRINHKNPVHPDITKYNLLQRTYCFSIPTNKALRLLRGVFLAATNFHKNPRAILRALNIAQHGRKAFSLQILYTIIPFLEKNYDVIHCHFGPSGNLAIILKELDLQKTILTTFHGWDIRLAKEDRGSIYHRLFEVGDGFISISNYSSKNLLDFGLDKNKILFHPVGIDLRKFSPGGQFSESSKDPNLIRILTVARLVDDKGLGYGIRAIDKLLREYPEMNVRYDIIGGGPLREELAELVRDLKLNEVVHLLGPQNQDDVIAVLERAHVFLLPSVAEVLPLALMEAQAMELPVVATEVGSTDEVVIEGKSGFLVPPRDADALADRLKYLIEHRDRWSEMGRFGRKHVEQHYDIDKLNDQLVILYQRLLDGQKGF